MDERPGSPSDQGFIRIKIAPGRTVGFREASKDEGNSEGNFCLEKGWKSALRILSTARSLERKGPETHVADVASVRGRVSQS